MSLEHDPFSEYHRARWHTSFSRIVAIAVSIAVSVGLVSLIEPAAAPQQSDASESFALAADSRAVPVEVVTLPSPPATGATAGEAPPAPSTLPALPVLPTTATLPSTGPASWSVSIDTRGHQAEIDQCLWVRMDVGGHAPIVGAHNYCGGGVVLDMALGDVVTLAGTELDGAYVVSDARDARAGDAAAAAIDGVEGQVILQTCYWGGNGRVRLVGLVLLAPGGP